MVELYQEIQKRKIILNSRNPYDFDVVNYVSENNLLDCIHSSLRLDGSVMTREAASKIIKGEVVEEATLGDHVLVENYKLAYKTAENMIEMNFNLDLKCLMKFYHVITDENLGFRRNNPVLMQYRYNPPHPQDIEEQMEILIRWLGRNEKNLNTIEKAVTFHNRFIEIYPFEKYTEAVARVALNYILMDEGLPPIGISLKEDEYNQAINTYIKKEDIQPLYSSVERSIYNKMEVILQLMSID